MYSSKQVKVHFFKGVSNYNQMTYHVLVLTQFYLLPIEYVHNHNNSNILRETKLWSVDVYTPQNQNSQI